MPGKALTFVVASMAPYFCHATLMQAALWVVMGAKSPGAAIAAPDLGCASSEGSCDEASLLAVRQVAHQSRDLDADGLNTSLETEGSVDLLTITQITCFKPDSGLAGSARDAFYAIGAGAVVVAAAAGSVATFGALPAAVATAVTAAGATVTAAGVKAAAVTVGAIAAAAATGNTAAQQATEKLNEKHTGTDNLMVFVDGEKLLPRRGSGKEYHNINGGETIKVNLRKSFKRETSVSFIEYDWGSNNDHMGTVPIEGGKTYSEKRVILMDFQNEGGAQYFFDYKVEKGKGNPVDVADYVLCGTVLCVACNHANCDDHERLYGRLDRDKDWSDLRHCPPGFHTSGHKWYDQWWPAADVYLKVCKRN